MRHDSQSFEAELTMELVVENEPDNNQTPETRRRIATRYDKPARNFLAAKLALEFRIGAAFQVLALCLQH
jgi:hypothetical protein